MKNIIFISLFLSEVVFSSIQERILFICPPKCPQYEEYKKCGCEPTCSTVLDEPCLDQNSKRNGCFCINGRIRSDDGTCIPIEECSSKVCEELNTKLYLSIKEVKVCVNHKPKTFHLARCMSKCDCVEGYVHESNIDGKCISETECTAGLDCTLPAETGPCKAFMPSYYFDVNTKTCEFFIYGGCGGNSNRFATKEECEKYCASKY